MELDVGRTIVGGIRIPDNRAAAEVVWRDAQALVRPVEAGGVGMGGVLVFGGEVDELPRRLAELEQMAGRPLLVASDMERGAGQQVSGATLLPHLMALAASGSEELVREAAALTASEARTLGVNLVFAPCADLANEPGNPIIGPRAFGDDPDAVAANVRAWIEGAQAQGVLACAKHYPGHGAPLVDSHIALPHLDASRGMLADRELVPFRAAIRARVGAVMTAHMCVPALGCGEGEAVTLSASAVGYLRRDLGFDGLIVTDALLMAGIGEGVDECTAAVRAITAGCDVLLYPNDVRAVYQSLKSAVEVGQVPAEVVRLAVGRIDATLASLSAQRCADIAPANKRVGERLAALALTAICGQVPAPLTESAGAQVIIVSGDADTSYEPLRTCLADQRLDLSTHTLTPEASQEQLEDVCAHVSAAADHGKAVHVILGVQIRAWRGSCGFDDGQRSWLRHLLQLAPEAAVYALGTPQLLTAAPRGNGFRACSFSNEKPSQRALAQALLDGGSYPGKAPLNLDVWAPELAGQTCAQELTHG